jgi:hypothetical protein
MNVQRTLWPEKSTDAVVTSVTYLPPVLGVACGPLKGIVAQLFVGISSHT